MTSAYDLVLRLTSGDLHQREVPLALRDFSLELGWRPSYHLEDPAAFRGIATAHLVVEHGLETSAVITFLGNRSRLSQLPKTQLNDLLSISYNNLVDWHLYVEPERVSFCYNRVEPVSLVDMPLSRSNYEGLRSNSFEEIQERHPSPVLPSLDEALIRTISNWKRIIAAELGYAVPNENLSALFNAIIFARAAEDLTGREGRDSRILLTAMGDTTGETVTPRSILARSLRTLVSSDISRQLFDEDKLRPFDSLSRDTVANLFSEFYRNRYAPYRYDFSLMSKHALSRIYEHYTSLLHLEDSPQASFFPRLPEEERNKTYGSVYTPQFIARFFARFLQEHTPPRQFRQLKLLDPACGSGIFLRTMLELQCDPIQDGVNSRTIRQAFDNVVGWDVDENAAQATRLSLALLHLLLLNDLPEDLHIQTTEAVDEFQRQAAAGAQFDAVMGNPPFIHIGLQLPDMRQRLAKFLGTDASGRIDSYLAFVRMALELLRPGGLGLLVLPHSFLLSDNARRLRQRLADECWILFLGDLSAIRVFQETGSYVILLVFQRKTGGPPPLGTVLKCQEFVGRALAEFLDGRRSSSTYYSIYDVNQVEFSQDPWIILPPREASIRRRMRTLPRLGELAEVRLGMVTGADDVFILDDANVPKGEEAAFVPLLPDRQMRRYDVPERTGVHAFYPFKGGEKFTGHQIEAEFPQTWRYLGLHRDQLARRRAVEKGQLEWWEPERPRLPDNLMRPKVVTPHLAIVPRFSLDRGGRFAVSRSPLLYPKQASIEDDLLRFLIAVLNSPVCYWFISTHSHKYGKGYTMLEPKSLKQVPIPNPLSVSPADMRRLLQLVDKRLSTPVGDSAKTEAEIENLVADLYGLAAEDRRALAIGEVLDL